MNTSLTPKRRMFIFKSIAIISPLVLLGILEITLRLAGYGYNYELFIPLKDHPGYVRMNPDVTKKYFTINQNATQGLFEPFTEKKGYNTTRLFVLGESTAIGFPYHQSGSFHRMLQYRLQQQFPDKNIEIINLALTAVNSYTIVDFSKQILPYKPDAVLIYLGHNEYYGALGAGSTSNLGNNPILIKTALYLKKFKIYQLLDDFKNKFFRKDQTLVDYKKTLMERMVKKQEIEYSSETFSLGIRQFSVNLDKVLSVFSKEKIPVFCSSVVCNYKDLQPFISSKPQKPAYVKYWKRGLEFASSGSNDSAYACFKKLISVSPEVAIYHYKLAWAALNLGKIEEAKKEFTTAKEFDLLRFRAPEAINKSIEQQVRKYKTAYLVDSKRFFEANSPDNIIGNNLITEHVHPNLKGYGLIAEAFYQAFKKNNCFNLNWKEEKSNHAEIKVPVTVLDTLYGEYQVKMLKELWPFNQHFPRRDTANLGYEEKISGGLAVKTINWEQGFNSLLNYYINRKDWFKALKLFESQIPDMPFNDLRKYTMAMQLAENANEYETAIFYAQKCQLISNDFSCKKTLFINYLKLDKPEKAIVYITDAMQNSLTNVDLSQLELSVKNIISQKNELKETDNKIPILIKIFDNYLKIGNYVAARKYIEEIKKLDKNNLEVFRFEKQIKKDI